MQDRPGSPAAFGHVTHFASHSWTYKFGELVGLLEGHYAGLAETKGGRLFVPVYYWVDILAVTQHFSGDFKDHPDSDFPGVIKDSASVLFTMHPWRSPVAPTRVWCLFEALTALQSGVSLDVVLDMGASRDVSTRSLMTIVSSIDVRASQATVPADRIYLLGCIEAGPGASAFNNVMRKALMANLLKAMANKCTEMEDMRGLAELMKLGACRRPDGVLDVPAALPYATTTDVVSLLDGLTAATCPRGLVLAGYLHCLLDFPDEDPETGAWSVMEHGSGGRGGGGGREAWSYMPVSDAVAGAVGRLLQRQPSTAHRGSYEEGSNVLGGLLSMAATAAAAAAAGHSSGGSAAAVLAAAAAAGGVAAGGGSGSFSDMSTMGAGLRELYLSLREAKHTGKMVAAGSQASPSRASRAGSGGSPVTSTSSPHGSFRAPVAGRRAGSVTGAKMLATANSLASLAVDGSGGGGGGGMSRPTEVDAGVAGREELWYGLSLRTPLQLLCLHRSSLTLRDAGRLKEALEHNTTLRTLQIIEPELDEDGRPGPRRSWRTRTVYEGYARECGRATPHAAGGHGQHLAGGSHEETPVGELIGALLEAALASSSLQRIAIVAPRTCLIERLAGLPGGSGHGSGAGGARDASGAGAGGGGSNHSGPLLPLAASMPGAGVGSPKAAGSGGSYSGGYSVFGAGPPPERSGNSSVGGGLYGALGAGNSLSGWLAGNSDSYLPNAASAGSASTHWGASGGPGSAVRELVVSPVTLSPKATEQLAAALAALPMLNGGSVDARKVPPRGWPGMTAPRDGDWWYVGDRLCYKYPDGWEPRPVVGGMQWVLDAAGVRRRYAGQQRQRVVVARRHVDKERAGRFQYQPPVGSEALMPDLHTVLEVLDKDPEGRTPGPRAAALRHWLVAAAGPGAVPPPPRGVEYPMGGDDVELGVLEALEEAAAEYRGLAEAALQEAPRKYWDRVSNGNLVPTTRLGQAGRR
ncbi:hypothetical protein HXX76_014385 [Chlamydomonas incerta]|uniref:Uncharacterized protein n=1 Tax=Chlamydomonas incerta TaxID=51695 RepID=A0A835VTF7_CHLIN|nr:hypothetical protein HXX76_014385 [Chlamydomonas incerta]|eukprot:KAG2424661.1 hypothetical protein HXX76_014385 [Chlamydomonas incerta]